MLYEPGYRPALINVNSQVNRTDKEIKITWDLPSEPVFQYFIYRKKNDGAFELIKTVKGNLPSFADKNLNINNIYYYQIIYQTEAGFRSLKNPELKILY